MTTLDNLPFWLALPVAVLLVLGSTLTLLGAFGLLHLKSFYDRIHAPTLGASWGAAATLLASFLGWSWAQDRLIPHEIVIGVFIMVTAPITVMLLGRAAVHRDRAAGIDGIPARVRPEGDTDDRQGTPD